MIKRFINTKNIDKADVVLISAPYEKGATFHKGTAVGRQRLLNALIISWIGLIRNSNSNRWILLKPRM